MDVEDGKYFGICKCCLRDGCFRSLWVECKVNGVVQNLGDMLNECFDLCWQKPDNDHLEQICDTCVSHTKHAYLFRHLVLKSQDRLNGVCRSEVKEESDIKCEELDTIYEELNTDGQSVDQTDVDVSEQYVTVIVKTEDSEENFEEYGTQEEITEYIYDDNSALETFEEVEYLEEDGQGAEYVDEADLKSKWQRKRKRGGRREYKQYTVEDLKYGMEAVKSGAMTVGEAAAAFNIPRKTLAAKTLSERRGEPARVPPGTRAERLIREVQTLLTYTNLVPYKSRTARLHCAYCSTGGPRFDDAAALRAHTRTKHAGERTKSVEQFLKPIWLNEVLKVDIENLHCTICCTHLASWNDMFKHLLEQHNLEFDEAYTRVIPFILSSDWRCALCKESFPNYHHLDSHMNAHYSNYMCSDCGDTFLAESRLKKHLQIHESGRHPCEECGKTFTLRKYLTKHVELVHKQNRKVRCLYCPEKFHGNYPRHLHVLAAHRDKIKTITCELCGKSFDWRPYYLSHMRRKHENERKYQCSYCYKQFFMKSELVRHEMGHTGEKYTCEICGKQFANTWVLNVHYKSHGVERGRRRLKAPEVSEKVGK